MDDNVVQFRNKCDMCVHLGLNGVCESRVTLDNDPIVVVSRGKHTSDYYVCCGEDFELRRTPTWKKKIKHNKLSNE